MKKISDIDEWTFNKQTPVEELIANVSIRLKYIDIKTVLHLTPKERISAIDNYFKENLSKLLKVGQFETYKLTGSKKRPTGIETIILIKNLEKFARYRFVSGISIISVKGGKKLIKKEPPGFYCIKMTVAIQVEGFETGMQSYEERYVLIKARSFDEAYKKVERQMKKYEKPYLNSDGRLVRWKLERLDDCFITDIMNADELNSPEGAEVFSVLKSRRLKAERSWDGKLD